MAQNISTKFAAKMFDHGFDLRSFLSDLLDLHAKRKADFFGKTVAEVLADLTLELVRKEYERLFTGERVLGKYFVFAPETKNFISSDGSMFVKNRMVAFGQYIGTNKSVRFNEDYKIKVSELIRKVESEIFKVYPKPYRKDVRRIRESLAKIFGPQKVDKFLSTYANSERNESAFNSIESIDENSGRGDTMVECWLSAKREADLDGLDGKKKGFVLETYFLERVLPLFLEKVTTEIHKKAGTPRIEGEKLLKKLRMFGKRSVQRSFLKMSPYLVEHDNGFVSFKRNEPMSPLYGRILRYAENVADKLLSKDSAEDRKKRSDMLKAIQGKAAAKGEITRCQFHALSLLVAISMAGWFGGKLKKDREEARRFLEKFAEIQAEKRNRTQNFLHFVDSYRNLEAMIEGAFFFYGIDPEEADDEWARKYKSAKTLIKMMYDNKTSMEPGAIDDALSALRTIYGKVKNIDKVKNVHVPKFPPLDSSVLKKAIVETVDEVKKHFNFSVSMSDLKGMDPYEGNGDMARINDGDSLAVEFRVLFHDLDKSGAKLKGETFRFKEEEFYYITSDDFDKPLRDGLFQKGKNPPENLANMAFFSFYILFALYFKSDPKNIRLLYIHSDETMELEANLTAYKEMGISDPSYLARKDWMIGVESLTGKKVVEVGIRGRNDKSATYRLGTTFYKFFTINRDTVDEKGMMKTAYVTFFSSRKSVERSNRWRTEIHEPEDSIGVMVAHIGTDYMPMRIEFYDPVKDENSLRDFVKRAFADEYDAAVYRFAFDMQKGMVDSIENALFDVFAENGKLLARTAKGHSISGGKAKGGFVVFGEGGLYIYNKKPFGGRDKRIVVSHPLVLQIFGEDIDRRTLLDRFLPPIIMRQQTKVRYGKEVGTETSTFFKKLDFNSIVSPDYMALLVNHPSKDGAKTVLQYQLALYIDKLKDFYA